MRGAPCVAPLFCFLRIFRRVGKASFDGGHSHRERLKGCNCAFPRRQPVLYARGARLQRAPYPFPSAAESMSDTASSLGEGSEARLASHAFVSAIPRSGSSWVRVVQSIRRSLDQHLKPYFKASIHAGGWQWRPQASSLPRWRC